MSGVELQDYQAPSHDHSQESEVVQIHEAKDKGLSEKKEALIQFLTHAELARKYETTLSLEEPQLSRGLDASEAEKRLMTYGPNVLTPPKERSAISKFVFDNLGHPLLMLLYVSGIVDFIGYGYQPAINVAYLYQAIICFGGGVLTAIFSFIQEGRASNAMKAFRNMLPRTASVIRDGRVAAVPATNLVPGDIVRVAGGDQVPADIRLIWVNELQVELSSLTGESAPVACTLTTESVAIEQATNIIFNTARCVQGEGIGVVFATGDYTMIGKIARVSSDTTQVQTPIQKETNIFVRNIAIFAFVIGAIFFILALAQKQPVLDSFINSFVLMLIAIVPQGLPLTVVSCLAITAKRLAERSVFVKELRSVETLGSTTVLASDKTGTLTQNKMVASRIWLGGIAFTEASIRGVPKYKRGAKDDAQALELLQIIGGICNRTRFEDEKRLTEAEAGQAEMLEALQMMDPNASLRRAKREHPLYMGDVRQASSMTMAELLKDQKKEDTKTGYRDDEARVLVGEPTDMAIFRFVARCRSVELLRYHWPIVFQVPFNSTRKFAICIVKPNHVEEFDASRKLIIKGAPEMVLSRCSQRLAYGVPVPIDEEFKAQFTAAYESFANQGERVIGFAYMDLPLDRFPPEFDEQYSLEPPNFPLEGLTFIGLMSLVDPPKDSVPGAIHALKEAGIRVIMVTGDHPLTGAAIARQVGILESPTRDQLAQQRCCDIEEVTDHKAIVLRGDQIAKFTEADWDRVLQVPEIVFARTTPQQKLEIVTQLQRLGEICAVTGDGVNDAPALKKGDIGVAMGLSGSDATRDAADVILLNDDIASVVDGVCLGRAIFDNLKKTVCYTLIHLVAETIPGFVNLIAFYPLAMTGLCVLLIDLGTELAPAVSFAYEPPEQDVMHRPPRNPKTDRLVNKQMIFYIIGQMGVIQTCWCFTGFAIVMWYYSVNPNKLWETSSTYWQTGAPNYTDPTSGVVLDADAQTTIINEAQTLYWVMLVGSQVFHIFMAKTKLVSIFVHGIFNNMVMFYGVLIEITLIVIIVYVPSSNTICGTLPFPGQYWALLLGVWATIFVYQEGSKWLRRNHPGIGKYFLYS